MSSLQRNALAYVETRVQEITKKTKPGTLSKGKEPLEERIMAVLCSREFNHLSKIQQREQNGNLLIAAQKKISGWVKDGAPISLYLDLGGGYHAAIDPNNLNSLTFTPGLGELLVLSQIKSFRDKVIAFYPPGIEFVIVIDNWVSHIVNSVKLAKTEEFCAEFKALIAHFGLDFISLLVESEFLEQANYPSKLSPKSRTQLTNKDYCNVVRFLGLECPIHEAKHLAGLYMEAIGLSEAFLNPMINGIRLTQRPTETTLGFRPFRGGSARIQCGQVAIKENTLDKPIPFLLTTSNFDFFKLILISLDKSVFGISDFIAADVRLPK